MAFDDYFAVRNASVYEGMGFAKAILKEIAMYMHKPTKSFDGSPVKPDPNDGWCWASQERLAFTVGCSADIVGRWTKRFQEDNWIIIEVGKRDEYGHVRNRYHWTKTALEKLESLEWDNHDERPKNPNKSRPGNTERLVQNSKRRAAMRNEARQRTEPNPPPIIPAPEEPALQDGAKREPETARVIEDEEWLGTVDTATATGNELIPSSEESYPQPRITSQPTRSSEASLLRVVAPAYSVPDGQPTRSSSKGLTIGSRIKELNKEQEQDDRSTSTSKAKPKTPRARPSGSPEDIKAERDANARLFLKELATAPRPERFKPLCNVCGDYLCLGSGC